MRGGVADEAAHVLHAGVALQRRGDEVPAAVARVVAGDVLGECGDKRPQRLPSDGAVGVGDGAADGDIRAVVLVIEGLSAFDGNGATVIVIVV